MKKILALIIAAIGGILLLSLIAISIYADYQYSKNYESYWELAVKASTITKKIEGIDKFVEALTHSNLQGKHNALFLETPDNSFDENFDALKSLQVRLHEIQGMDIASFQYQTALAQITQQEQNEARNMLNVFSGIWYKENHFFLWGWPSIMYVAYLIVVILVGLAIWSEFSL